MVIKLSKTDWNDEMTQNQYVFLESGEDVYLPHMSFLVKLFFLVFLVLNNFVN